MANQQIIEVKTLGTEKASRSLGKVDRSIGDLATSALKYAAAAGAIIAVTKKAIDAYGIQEQAEKRLEVATGRNIDALKRQAAALQQVTTFGDEMILGVQASIAAFVDDEEAIKKATAATLDLAAATGMDLKSAGDLVAKSLGSSTNALSRYGIEVTGAVGSTERLDTLVGNIADKFDGQAAAAAETMAGSIQQAKNAMGDAAESIGGLLAPAVTQIAQGFKWAAENVQAFIASINANALEVTQNDDKLAKLRRQMESYAVILGQVTEGSAIHQKTSEAMRKVTEEYTLIIQKQAEAERKLREEIEATFTVQMARAARMPELFTAQNVALMEQQQIITDLRTDYDKYGGVMLENGLKGVAMAQDQAAASKALANQYLVEGVFGYVKSALANIPFPFGLIAAGIAATGANALFNSIVPTKSAATEMDEVITRPTYIRVGDQPGSLGERVTVSHAGGSPQGGGGVNITFNGNVTDREYVRGFIIPEIQKAMRLNA
jgi:hypothetical protein